MAPLSAWEELQDALQTSTGGLVGRGLRFPLLMLLLLLAQASILSLLSGGLVGLVAWGLVLLVPYSYARQVQAARAALRQAVLGGSTPVALPNSSLGRVRSLLSLREAFLAIQRRDSLAAEIALQRVDRADLGAWESRVLEAVRVLNCLDRGEQARAAQLAPLALPIGDASLDRRIGCLMVRAAWEEQGRLGAVERALFAAGAALHDLVLLSRIRSEELQGKELSVRFAPRVCRRVCEAAAEVGDERLAGVILAAATSQGAYR